VNASSVDDRMKRAGDLEPPDGRARRADQLRGCGSLGNSLGSYAATRWSLPRESGRLTRCGWRLFQRSRFEMVLVE
jgi:hypothetical protein